jgi:hypothetical protein
MRQYLICVALCLTVLGAAANHAQSVKVTNLDEHATAMRAMASALKATSDAIGAGSMAAAKASLAALRTNMVAVQAFWDGHKKADQTKFANDVVVAIDHADDFLTDNDASAADAAMKQIQSGCGGCHKATRDPDPADPHKFVVKPGVL